MIYLIFMIKMIGKESRTKNQDSRKKLRKVILPVPLIAGSLRGIQKFYEERFLDSSSLRSSE